MFCCCQPKEKKRRRKKDQDQDNNNRMVQERLLAAQFGDIDRLRSLCKNSQDVNMMADTNKNHNMMTPLHAAVIGAQLESVLFLLEMGANPNHRCCGDDQNDCRTPLHNACARGTVQIVELLLKADSTNINDISSDVVVEGSSSRTALDFAMDWSRKDIQELLLRKGGKRAKDLLQVVVSNT